MGILDIKELRKEEHLRYSQGLLDAYIRILEDYLVMDISNLVGEAVLNRMYEEKPVLAHIAMAGHAVNKLRINNMLAQNKVLKGINQSEYIKKGFRKYTQLVLGVLTAEFTACLAVKIDSYESHSFDERVYVFEKYLEDAKKVSMDKVSESFERIKRIASGIEDRENTKAFVKRYCNKYDDIL